MENNALAVTSTEEGPVTTFPWGQIAAFLTDQGIAEEHLPAAFLTIIVMVSAKLGAPMALVFIEDKDSQAAVGIVEVCKTVMPSENYCVFCTLPRKKLLSCGSLLAGKAIICSDASELNKVSTDIKKLLETGIIVDNDFEMGREGVNLVTRNVRGDVALVTISCNKKDKILEFPKALKIRLPQVSQNQQQTLQNAIRRCSSANQSVTQHSTAWLKASFKGIEPIDINLGVILGNVATLMGELGNDIETMARLVKIITILNKFSEISDNFKAEALFYELSPTRCMAMVQASQKSETAQRLLPYSMSEVVHVDDEQSTLINRFLSGSVTASKVDYYFFELIMREWLPTAPRNTALTPEQMRIYNAIKKRNFDFLESNPFVDMNNPVEIINTITGGWSQGCISVAQLEEDLKHDGNVKILTRTPINSELKALMDMDIITRLKHPHSPNRFDYAIATLSPGQPASALPHPSQLNCPTYGQDTVRVKNPLTQGVDII